jgi:hypothetical protein
MEFMFVLLPPEFFPGGSRGIPRRAIAVPVVLGRAGVAGLESRMPGMPTPEALASPLHERGARARPQNHTSRAIAAHEGGTSELDEEDEDTETLS